MTRRLDDDHNDHNDDDVSRRVQTRVTCLTASWRNCVGASLPNFSGTLSRTRPKLKPPYLNDTPSVN